MLPWLLLPAAYLLGSISAAYLAGKAKGIDLRQHGSGNLGATNAGRVLGGRWFAVVFITDVLKGLLPTLAAQLIDCPEDQRGYLLVATAAAAVLGHVFTCFHGFKGGKAVATSLGVLLGVAPLVAGLVAATWLVGWGFCLWKWSMAKSAAVGPASSLAAFATPFLRFLTCATPFTSREAPVTVFLVLLALLVLVKHTSNLKKFLAERKAAKGE